MPPFVEMLHQIASAKTDHHYYPSDLLQPAIDCAKQAINDE